MRIILMYDLPMLTSSDRRIYRRFHKDLLDAGFVHMQHSIYTKLVLNATQRIRYESYVRSRAPEKGSIVLLSITERQYSQMDFVIGTRQTRTLQSDDRLVLW